MLEAISTGPVIMGEVYLYILYSLSIRIILRIDCHCYTFSIRRR